MKLSPRTFRVEWELHAWVGVVASILLFVVFFCGIFALFHEQLTLWQEPTQAHSHSAPPSFGRLLAAVEQTAPLARGTSVSFEPQHGARVAQLSTIAPGAKTERVQLLDVDTLARTEARSHLAEELYNLHFLDQLPLGGELAGVVAVALLISVVSGFLIHLKDLRRQWLQLRPRLRLRHVASDLHKLIGVLVIPFLLVLGWSGSLLCLGEVTLASLTTSVLGGDEQKAAQLHYGPEFTRPPSGLSATMLPIDQLVLRAQELSGQAESADYLTLRLAHDQNAWLEAYFPKEGLGAYSFVFLDALTGDVLARSSGDDLTPSTAFERILHGLHFAHFGGFLIKLLYTALALSTCVLLISGNLIWLERRDPLRERRGNRLLERVTVAIPTGLVAATGVYFVANRLLPATQSARAELEFALFAGAWVVLAALGMGLEASLARRSFVLASLASGLFALALVLDVTHYGAALTRDVGERPAAFWQVRALLLVLVSACVGLAAVSRPRAPRTVPRRTQARAEGAHRQTVEL
ncbi:MAG: hypothetical protein RLZZ450_824 [Pseudomonadota bacterium]|jgi:uncharacterized iron-regulated membrane protein